MGCGGSRLDPSSDTIPSKLRPLLRRRYEEINRRRNGGHLEGSSTLSKKALLKAGVSDEDSSFQSNSQERDRYIIDRKSVPSYQEDSLKVAPEPEPSSEGIMIKDIVVVEDLKKPLLAVSPKAATTPEFTQNKPLEAHVAPALGSAPAPESEKSHRENSNEQNGVKTAIATPGVELVETSDEEGKDTEEDDEEEGRRGAQGGCFCPGSPSFRVFLSDSSSNANDDEEDDDTDKILQSEGNGGNVESVDSNEGSIEKKEQKGKKGRGFRKVMHMPKARPGVVKNLLPVNMKSCYNPASSGGHEIDNARLLSQKAA